MKQRKVTLEHHGPATLHDVLCWACNKRSAVYSMHPVWAFEPCWKCNEQIGGELFRVRSKFLKWLLRNFDRRFSQ